MKNDMRYSLRIMRNLNNGIIESKEPLNETPKDRHMTMRGMLGKMRKLKEDTNNGLGQKKTTPFDEKREEEKFLNYFNNNQINVEFIPIEIYDNRVFWGGTIDGQLQFVYKVTPNENTSGYELNYLEGFDKNNPENDDVVKKIQNYYDDFYKYWRDNVIQK
jgi:hypothetical protein